MDIKLELNTLYTMDAVEFLKALPDAGVDLVYTDPPYNVSQRHKIYRDYRNGQEGSISFDYGEWDYAFDPIPFLIESKRVLNEYGSLIVWTSEQLYGTYRQWAQDNMLPKQMIIWEKTNPVPNFRKVSYRQATEIMFWASKNKISKRNPNFIFTTQEGTKNIKRAPICGGSERIKRPDTGKSHPNQKPLSICKEIIQTHCREDGVVVDPFCGVGSIPLAAKITGRNFIGNDFDTVYAQMARERLLRAA